MALEDREIGRVTSADFVMSRGVFPDVRVVFDYGGSGQCLGGYRVDIDFLVRLLGVFNAKALQEVVGKDCWVTHRMDKILKLEPLPTEKGGKPFDLEEWGTLARARYRALETAGVLP